MHWILRKVDSLAGTAVAAIVGLATAQVLAFIHAYLQRLGGHVDEARHAARDLIDGPTAALVHDETLRMQMLAAAQARIDALNGAYEAIDRASVFAKPFVFVRHLDHDIAMATALSFHPALPLDMPSLVFGFAGIVLGWILWEIVKLPFAVFRAPSRARS